MQNSMLVLFEYFLQMKNDDALEILAKTRDKLHSGMPQISISKFQNRVLGQILARFLGSEPVPFVGSQVEMDRDETVKLLFLGIPALVLSLSLFTSAFRVGDMLLWYFREIKVR